MVHIIFRHISGSRATEVDVIALGAHRELILGRAMSAAVRFHPWRDSRVGRHHARIIPDEANPRRPLLMDLGSRNGTYVNGTRVAESVLLQPGDILQLGSGGPEIEVMIEIVAELAASDP